MSDNKKDSQKTKVEAKPTNRPKTTSSLKTFSRALKIPKNNKQKD